MSNKEAGRERKQEGIVHAISLDYDGCGEVLFSAPPSKAKKSDKPEEVNRQELARKFSLSSSQAATKLFSALDAIVKDSKKTTLLIGSARQSDHDELENIKRNKNGFCKLNYDMLAQKKGWVFNPMRVSEHYDESRNAISLIHRANEQLVQPVAADLEQARNNLDKAFKDDKQFKGKLASIKEELSIVTRDKVEEQQALKIYLITKQMESLSASNPGSTVHFHFIDDRPEILEAVNLYFTRVSPPPKNVVLNLYNFKCVKYENEDNVEVEEEFEKIAKIDHASFGRDVDDVECAEELRISNLLLQEEIKKIDAAENTLFKRSHLTAALIGGLSSIVPIAFGFPLYAIVLIPAALSLLAFKLSGEIELVNPEDKKILLGLSMFAAVLLCGGAAALALGAFEFAVAGAVIAPLVASGPIGIALFCAGVAAAFAYIAYDIYKSWPTETVINGANANYGAAPYKEFLPPTQNSEGPDRLKLGRGTAPAVSSQEKSQAQVSAAPAPDVPQAQSGQASYDAAALQPSQQPQGWASRAGSNAHVVVQTPREGPG
jgi:hypothetical protein